MRRFDVQSRFLQLRGLFGCVLLVGMAISLLTGATAKSAADGPAAVAFQDGFEGGKQLLDFLPADGSRWTHFQRTFPENRIDIVSEGAREGRNAARFFAVPSRSDVSKSDVERRLRVGEGDVLTIRAWLLLPEGPSLDDVFILDLECESCWPDFSLFPNKSPGIRLQLKGDDGLPIVERGKIGLDDYQHEGPRPVRSVPRGRWTLMAFRVKLASDASGRVEVSFDDELAFAGSGSNLPDPRVFGRYGIRLKHRDYDRFQIGITANGSDNPVEMLLDDVSVEIDRRNR